MDSEMSYSAQMSRILSQCMYAKFSVWSSRHSCTHSTHHAARRARMHISGDFTSVSSQTGRTFETTEDKRGAGSETRICSGIHARAGTLAWMEPPRETMPVTRLAVRGDVPQQHASMDGEVVHALQPG